MEAVYHNLDAANWLRMRERPLRKRFLVFQRLCFLEFGDFVVPIIVSDVDIAKVISNDFNFLRRPSYVMRPIKWASIGT